MFADKLDVFPVTVKLTHQPSLQIVWEWDGNRYVPTNEHWSAPDKVCDGGIREEPKEVFSVKQGSSDWELLPMFITNQTPSDFYGYADASFNNNDFYDLLGADKSVIFVHYSLLTKKYSVSFLHDINDNTLDLDGGDIELMFTETPLGNKIAVMDDPNDSISIKQIQNVNLERSTNTTPHSSFHLSNYLWCIINLLIEKVGVAPHEQRGALPRHHLIVLCAAFRRTYF